MRDLGRVEWEAVLDAWPDSAADYNHMRRMVSRALTLLVGDTMHPARRAILKDIPRATEPRSRKNELSVARFLEIVERIPGRPVREREAVHASEEPARRLLDAAADRDANGRVSALRRRAQARRPAYGRRARAKTEGSAAHVAVDPALWHWIDAGIPSQLDHKWLRIQWKRAAKAAGFPSVRLHDIRRLAANAGPATTMHYAAVAGLPRAASRLARVVSVPVGTKARKPRSA